MSENCSTFALVMENLMASFQDLMVGLFAGMSSLAIILVCVFCGLLAAVNRHRDPLGWALLSFFVSPVLTWIILLIAGDAR